jgi:sigma-B regulation protein RsbQ
MPGTVVAVVGVETLHDAEFRRDEAATDKFMEPLERDFKGTVRAGSAGMFHADTPAELREWVVSRMEVQDRGAAIALMRDHSGLDRKALLKEARVPVRCINSGAGFPYFKPTAIATNQRYADFEAVILDGVGHYPMLEKPAEFNRSLREVLETLAGRR